MGRPTTSRGERYGDFMAMYYCADKHNWKWRCVHCHYIKTATASQMRNRPALHTCRICHKPTLTPREGEITMLVAQGMNNKEIAHKLGISDKTVAVTLTTIYAKLGVNGRVQLAVWYHKEMGK
jgi:DNA-binding CsgD family transcriptional regulator